MILIITAATTEAFAVTYYVSTIGNDNNSGALNAPFLTIQKAANIVNPGDTVIVRNGTYTCASDDCVYINRSGNSSSPITFRAENKWKAVIDGEYRYKRLIGFGSNAAYTTVEGFELKRATENGFHTSSGITTHHITIRKNYIHHIHNTYDEGRIGRNAIYVGDAATYFNIQRNYAHDIGRTGPSNLLSLDHFAYLNGKNGNGGGDHLVEYNIVEGCNQAIATARNTVVRNNVLTGGPNKAVLIIGLDANNTIVENNIFYNIPSSYECIWVASSWDMSNKNITIRNNLCHGGKALIVNNPTITQIYNNIIGKDPNFIDPFNSDYQLRADSPAIDNGIIGNQQSDYEGNPIIGKPDIGAYEYNSQTPGTDNVSPAQPASLRMIVLN